MGDIELQQRIYSMLKTHVLVNGVNTMAPCKLNGSRKTLCKIASILYY